MHYGKLGIGLISGYYKVLSPLSAAKDPKRLIKRLNKKGVRNRKIRFLGFLKVKMEFFLMSNPSCPKKPRGGGVI